MEAEKRQLLHEIIRLTIPAAIDFALQSAANYADYIMVGSLGHNVSAAIGLTTEVNFLIRGVLTALGVGIVSMIAVSEGRNEKDNSRKIALQSLNIAIAAGVILFAAAMAVSPYLPYWLGADEATGALAGGYFRITYYGIIGASFNMMFGSVLKGYGDMKTPMYVNVGMNVLNIILNGVLIFDHCIFIKGTGLGINGAAWATAISGTAGGILMTYMAFRKCCHVHNVKELLPNKAIVCKILLIAIPVFLCRVVTSTGRILFTTFITGLGTLVFAAHSIAFTAESLFYMPVVGAQAAVTTLAGNIKGEGNPQKLKMLAWLAGISIASFMFLVGISMIVLARPVLNFFSSDAAVVDIGVRLFSIVAVNEPIFGISVVMEGIFQGIGDTRKPFIISAVSLWSVRVAGTWYAIHLLGAGVYGAWVCMVLENTVRGLVLIIAFCKTQKIEKEREK